MDDENKTKEQLINELLELRERIGRVDTGKKFSDEILKSGVAMFMTLTEQSIAGICLILDGKFVYVNPQLAKILNFGQEEMIGSTVLDFVAEKDREMVKENMRKRMSGEVPSMHYTFQALKKDGSKIEMEVHGSVMTYQGCPAIMGILLDITERKKMEEALKNAYNESERRVKERTAELLEINEELKQSEKQHRKLTREFNILLDAIVDNIILLSPDMKIMWANKSAALKFKRNVPEVAGEYCYKLCCGISAPCERCPAADSFITGREETSRIATSEGKFWDIRAFPVFDESGTVKNVIEVARDITAQVQMEEEAKNIQMRLIRENKMASLGTLVSGVVHEVNNPNSFILSNAQLLDTIWKDAAKILEQYQGSRDFSMGGIPFSELKGVVPKLIDGINNGSIRIKNIVDNLRDFSRADKMSLDGKVDINKTVMVSRAILDNQIKQRTDNFQMICEDGIPFARGSAQQIEQVVINVIMNALQSLPDRKCGVRVSTFFDKKSDHVVIQVADGGIGMSGDILSQATDLFFTTKYDSGGTGLGLSISYSIIKEHKGVLEFKSEPGQGTTVSVKLPVYDKQDKAY